MRRAGCVQFPQGLQRDGARRFQEQARQKGGDKQVRPGRSGQRDNPASDDHAAAAVDRGFDASVL